MRLVFLRAVTASLRISRCVGFVDCVGGVVVDCMGGVVVDCVGVDVGGLDVWLVECVVTDVDEFDRMVECAAECAVCVIVGVGMRLVERVWQVVGFDLDGFDGDVDGLGVSTLTILSHSLAS